MTQIAFFIGLHQPSDARHFARACISVNRLRERRGAFPAPDWMMDSGAFTEISRHGHYRNDVASYAAEVRRWAGCGRLLTAVAQDWMCEPFIVKRTGLTVAEHQRLTIERYDALLDHDLPVPVMPVLQGFAPVDYQRHLDSYSDRLQPGMWVGVGSVCKRNGAPSDVVEVLSGIASARPGLRLHGFGLKLTALLHPGVRAFLHSADSMAWSFAARREGRDANDWREAAEYERLVLAAAGSPPAPWQPSLPWGAAA